MKLSSMLVAASVLAVAATTNAAIVYDNTTTAATAGTSALNTDNRIYGDTMTLTSGGQLGNFACSLFNSTSSGNTGSLLTGSMVVNFYDNTVPYAGGAITGALLGSATLSWDFTAAGGLAAGFYTIQTFDLSSLNINLTSNILVTQQFTMLTGTSIRTGVVLLNNPTVGSSPNTFYLKSNTQAENLYTIANNPGQIAYGIEVIPAPGALALLSLAGLVGGRRRR